MIARLAHRRETLRVDFAQHARVGEERIRVRSARAELHLFELRERAAHRGARRETGRERELHVAVRRLERLHDARMVVAQIFLRDVAAHRAQIADDALRDVAFVEVATPGVGEAAHRGGEIGQHQPLERRAGGRNRRISARHPHGLRRGIARELACHRRDLEREKPVDGDALVRELDRGLHHVAEAHRAECLEREPQAVDVSRHGDRIRTVHVAIVLHRRPREEIAREASGERISGRIESARGDRTEVDDLDAIFLREIHEHEADAAEAAVPGLDGGEREAGRDRRIDRVAAGGEHLRAGFSGDSVLRCDDAAARARDGLADVPVLNEMIEHGGPGGKRAWEVQSYQRAV